MKPLILGVLLIWSWLALNLAKCVVDRRTSAALEMPVEPVECDVAPMTDSCIEVTVVENTAIFERSDSVLRVMEQTLPQIQADLRRVKPRKYPHTSTLTGEREN